MSSTVWCCFGSFQSRSDIGIHTRHSNLPGVNFPISEEALQKLTALRDKQITFVQLVNIFCSHVNYKEQYSKES